jgi:hypothetical protein
MPRTLHVEPDRREPFSGGEAGAKCESVAAWSGTGVSPVGSGHLAREIGRKRAETRRRMELRECQGVGNFLANPNQPEV